MVIMLKKFSGIEGINVRAFRVIYSRRSDKVYISYNGERLLTVEGVSDKYYLEGKNGLQIGELVANDHELDILNMILGNTPNEEEVKIDEIEKVTEREE